jgi:hypothetical protein
MRNVYQPIKDVASGKSGAMDASEMEQIARRAEAAIDLLLFSYAKAENMHRHPDEQYANLRSFWGVFLADAVQELAQTT